MKLSLVHFIKFICLKVFCHSAIFLAGVGVQHSVPSLKEEELCSGVLHNMHEVQHTLVYGCTVYNMHKD